MLVRQLNSVICDQEIIISGINIELFKQPKEEPVVKQPTLPKPDVLRELKALKELCRMYELECLTAKAQVDEARRLALKAKAKQKACKQKFEQDLKEIEATIKTELLCERKLNLDLRTDVSSELSVREALNVRQQEMITALQEELKSAKMVLKSTRLRHKFHETLKLSKMEEVPEYPGMRSRNRRATRMPKALSTLPRLERSMLDYNLKHGTSPSLRVSPDVTTKASTEFSFS